MPRALLCLLFLATTARADEPLAPRPVTFDAGTATLRAALAQLQRQSGNVVHDARRRPTDPKVTLPTAKLTFWPALDALAKAADVGIGPYQPDGLSLVDGPYRPLPTAYADLFRLAVRRRAVSFDEETRLHSCTVALEVLWEPRFEPFYVEAGPVAVVYGPDAEGKVQKETVVSRGQHAVAGRSATEFDLRFPAAPRSVTSIASLDGTLSAIGPTHLLGFTFDKLAPQSPPRQQTRDGVKLTLTDVRLGSSLLTLKIKIDNPPGPAFESFQTWLDNNRAALVRTVAGKTERWLPDASNDNRQGTSADVTYHFTLKGRRLSAADLAGWSLYVRTPGPIVRLEVPYRFRDLPLP